MNNPSAERKLIMILLSDEEWDILELKDAFGSGKTTRDNVISKVHEIFDQVHFVCVRNASNSLTGVFLLSSGAGNTALRWPD